MKKKYSILIPIITLFIISVFYLPNTLRIKQLIWILLSLFICITISNIPLSKILKYSVFYYVLSIILLVLVLILNIFTNGSRGWINIGLINIQPSELVKVTTLLFNIKYKNMNIVLLTLLNILPMVLIFLQPDTGGVIALLIIYLYFLFTKLNKKQTMIIIMLCIIIVLLTTYLIMFNKDLLIRIFGSSIIYRLNRLNTFINDNSIQSTNAIISIATSNLLYFPEMFNDFFISYVLCKNIYLVLLIVISTVCILSMLLNKNTTISKIVFYIIFIQCFYNLSMNLKLMPVIGIPYLFLSYGGSHIISSMILIGLCINKDNNSMVLA